MQEELLHGSGFSVRIQWNGRYLRAHVFDGTDSLQVSSDVWRLLSAQCARVGTRHLLAIEELDGTVAQEDLPALTAAQMACGFGDLRIAFVDLHLDVQGNETSELLLMEQDVQVKVFNLEADAERWLLYGA